MARVAAIDCGTNSIRLLVADVTRREDGSFALRDVHREMRIVRLGEGVDATGRLGVAALMRTRDALADYALTVRRKGAERVRMVATSATRDASNRDEFFSMTRDVLGTEAEVISGDEEARLSFTGAVGDLDPEDGPFLMTDIGGGSTELVLGTWDGVSASIKAAKSVDIGCVRITERCLRGDPPSAEEVAAGRELAERVLGAAFETVLPHGARGRAGGPPEEPSYPDANRWSTAESSGPRQHPESNTVPVAGARTWVGVAGTITTLAAVGLGLTEYDAAVTHLARLTLPELRQTTERLLAASHAERAANRAIHPGRVDVIGGGSLIALVLAEQLQARAGITELLSSEHDILDGIALSQL
jgi:exopolyphosphatase / guanosine-5'-triphosphate,3'-diphosphate pyrophosphatase